MINYNLERPITDWYNGSDNIKKVYYNDRIVYYKVTNTEPEPPIEDDFFVKVTLITGKVIEIDGSGELTREKLNQVHFALIDRIETGRKCTSIADRAFENGSLTAVTLSNTITSIGYYAFVDCGELTTINIPNSVKTIKSYAFHWCTSLSGDLVIPNSVTSIGQEAFQRCQSLTSVIIPDSVTSIGIEAFDNCRSLNSVEIGTGITNISDGLFYECTSLSSVTIPATVTSIGRYAFSNCTGLTEINVEGLVPATLNDYPFDYTNNCPIYVDCSVVNDYKNAWPDYADRITCRT